MRFFFLLALTFLFESIQAQTTNPFLKDLYHLRAILQKTPSYKDQIKGDRLLAYEKLFEQLSSDSTLQPSTYNYFYNLARLFFPIRDNHLGFYQVKNLSAEMEFPTFKGDIDSLKNILQAKPIDSLEGIFHYDSFYSVGLTKIANKQYIGVVVESNTPTWKKGQIAMHLYEFLPGYFKVIYAHPKTKTLILYPIEKYSHHTLVNSYFYSSYSNKVYSKFLSQTDYVNLRNNAIAFDLKKISPDVQYLRIKHFSANKAAMKVSQAFYDSIRNKLNLPNLILDLRNNSGGAYKVSKKFLSLIKKYVKHGNVYVLVNNGTISQGEIFTLQLKRLKNVQVLGQTTRGMLTYGSNYGKRERLPSNAYEVYITDMGGDKWLIPYENFGVKPDIVLTDSEDWVEQTMKIIGQ